MTTMGAAPKITMREWVGLIVLCLPTMLTTVDISVTILALPHISAALGTGSIGQLWIADIYGFMIAGCLITMGTLGERIGHRKVLLGGAVVFIAASVTAAYSNSTGMLIGARAVIGIAGATIMPSVLTLIGAMFRDPRQMGTAMGLWGSSVMVGLISGPIVGGLLLTEFWWGSVFLISIPVMALLLITGPFLLPEFRNPHAGRLDLPSVVLSLGAIIPTIYGIKTLGSSGFSWPPLIAVVAGPVLAGLFITRQRRIANPLLDLKLFRIRPLSSALMLGLLIAMIMGGTGLTVTIFMQLVRGMTPLRVALWLIVPSLALVLAGNVALRLSQQVRPVYLLMTGALVGVAGMVVLTRVNGGSGLALLIVGLVLVYIGGSPTSMMGAFLVMSSSPPEKMGSANSVAATSGELGSALGVALLGVVATAVYRSDLTVPASLPAATATSSKAGLVAAVSAAGHSPGPVGAALLHSARSAYTLGMHTVVICAAALFVLIGVVAYAGLRHVPPTGAMMPPPPVDAEQSQPVQPVD
jgi:DHA2 family multidrug resistance protein-like MFS transporter